MLGGYRLAFAISAILVLAAAVVTATVLRRPAPVIEATVEERREPVAVGSEARQPSLR